MDMTYHLRRLMWGLVYFAAMALIAAALGLFILATTHVGVGPLVLAAAIIGTSYLIGGAFTGPHA